MMKNQILIKIIFLLCNIWLFGTPLVAQEVSRLKLVQKYILDTDPYPQRMDLSGLTSDGKHLYTVSDLSDQNDIFRIELDPHPRLIKFMALDTEWLNEWQMKNRDHGRYDTEGIAYCDGKFYLAEESTRNVLEVNIQNSVYKPMLIEPNWVRFHAQKHTMNPFSGLKNAGLEAIACHQDKGSIFLFNERQFRMGYILTVENATLRAQFTIPSGFKYPRKESRSWIFPDFAGAHLHGGSLYTLVRNSQLIVKIDPTNFRVLKRWTYGNTARKIFKQKDFFGLAEGLAIYEGHFFVILDHNLWMHKNSEIRNPVLLKFSVEDGNL
tara:strand:- start:2203 stop:3171 length:969 start_codon:yes stop_codon:yes gene_type:complete